MHAKNRSRLREYGDSSLLIESRSEWLVRSLEVGAATGVSGHLQAWIRNTQRVKVNRGKEQRCD
jgi:hypothetical protein